MTFISLFSIDRQNNGAGQERDLSIGIFQHVANSTCGKLNYFFRPRFVMSLLRGKTEAEEFLIEVIQNLFSKLIFFAHRPSFVC